jgi:hypothetical protein
MSDFVSNVKTINYPQQAVYDYLSDLSHLEALKQRLADPAVMERIQQEADARNMGDLSQRLDNLTFDRDSLSIGGTPVGNLSLRIIEREEPKTIKLEGEGTPIPLTLWIQLLPVDMVTCKMRLTLRAELNFFIKQMVSKPLQEGVENIANMLAGLPYGEL